MGVARDKTLSDLISAVGGVDTSNLLTDATGVQIKNAILAIASAITTNNSLAGLNDVDLTNPTDGQTLVYDAINDKWINSTNGGGVTFSTLWSGTETPPVQGTTVNLSYNISDYDLLYFDIYDGSNYSTVTVSTNILSTGNYIINEVYNYNNFGIYCYVDSVNSITIKRISANYPVTYLKITGVKY